METSDLGNSLFAVMLHDGVLVEAVHYGAGSLCISSQAGCAMGCPFCASGSRGFLRNLTSEEMIAQVEAARKKGMEFQRVTISGIGEPLHNEVQVGRFMRWAAEESIPVSLTTTGASLEVLSRFLPGPDNGLMVSLHAGSAAVHRRLVPRGPELDRLWSCLTLHWPSLSVRRRRKIGFNYLLLFGVNDGDREIELLAERVFSFPEATLHLLTLNPLPGAIYSSPSAERVNKIHASFRTMGVNVRRANPWRNRPEGGCGTLWAKALP